MIYSHGDIYEGSWQNDLKHGYGILEKKNGDKYYGYWNNGLKEGQGYYYYSSTSKIYLGEWHDDVPRCGIFTDVDEDLTLKKKMHIENDETPMIPVLKLKSPDAILEDSINNIFFLRNIKLARKKTFRELFPVESHPDLIKLFKINNLKSLVADEEKENENKIPDNYLSLNEFKKIYLDNLGAKYEDQTLELIFYVFGIPFVEEEMKIDFLMFTRLLYLGYCKINGNKLEDSQKESAGNNDSNQRINYEVADQKLKEFHDMEKGTIQIEDKDEVDQEEDGDGINFDADEFEEDY